MQRTVSPAADTTRRTQAISGSALAVLVLALSALGLTHFATAQTNRAPGDAAPDGLSATDWSSVRAAYDAGRHRAFAVDGGYRAHNPGQQWSSHFDGRGFTTEPDAGGWSWGLELVRYGFAGQEHAVDAPTLVTAEGQRVAYDWDTALTEWYVNEARGLEHGYTIHQRPQQGDAGPLTFTLAVRGGLLPRVHADGLGVGFENGDGAAVLTYAGLRVFDADGREVAAHFEPVGDWLRLWIDEHGARYPLTIDPIAQQAYLKASNTGDGDSFGASVSVFGDTVVAGAPRESSSATGVNGDQSNDSAIDSGAAYVFVRNGSSWIQQAYLKASNTDADDGFGWSVSVSGDTVVVGAGAEDSNATGVNGDQSNNSASGSGAAYVFVRSGTSWSQQAYLKASNTEASDGFGSTVSVSGDTIVVGATFEDSTATGVNGDQSNNSASGSGAAYVFVRSGTSWSQQAYLKASNTGSNDNFGDFGAVSVSGDTVVIGAPREDSIATGVNGNQSDLTVDAGAAYVFVRSGTSWSQQAYLKASNTDARDRFGTSVSVSGDTVVVGALQEDSNATGVNGDQSNNSAIDSGAAYVFVWSGTSWSQEAYLKASNPGGMLSSPYYFDPGDRFGASVSVSGDTVVIGAPAEDSNATGVNGDQTDDTALESGAAYVFVRNGTSWSQHAYLKASNTDWYDTFGSAVSVSADTVVVGAGYEASRANGVNGDQADNYGWATGAAYLFHVRTDKYGCETPPAGFGAPTLAITAGAPQVGTTFDLSIQNPSPTAMASALGFELFVPPISSPQNSVVLFGFCWNLPLPFAGSFVPVPPSVVLPLTLPNAPSMVGIEVDWQVIAIDPASTSSGLALTASRGLTTRLSTRSPTNDDCATALPIGDGETPGSNFTATTSVPTGSCGFMGRDVWYTYTAGSTGTATVATVSTCLYPGAATFDMAIAAFSGTCGALTEIACGSRGCGSSPRGALTTFPVTAGTTYYIAAGGYGGAVGSFNLFVTVQ